MEGIFLEKDPALALVFVGNYSVSIRLNHFVCERKVSITDKDISRYVREEQFLNTDLIIPRKRKLLSKGNPVTIFSGNFMTENDAHERI